MPPAWAKQEPLQMSWLVLINVFWFSFSSSSGALELNMPFSSAYLNCSCHWIDVRVQVCEVLNRAQSPCQLHTLPHAALLVRPDPLAAADELNLAVFFPNHTEDFNERGDHGNAGCRLPCSPGNSHLVRPWEPPTCCVRVLKSSEFMNYLQR